MQKRGKNIAILAIVILLIILSYFLYNSLKQLKEEENYNTLGWKLYKEGKYDEAIAEFKKYIKRNPRNFFAHTGLGWSLYKKGIYDEAIESFNTAIKLNPKSYDPYNGLGWSNYRVKDYGQAVSNFEQAIKLNSEYYDPYNGLGWSYQYLNSTEHYWEYNEKNRNENLDKSIEAFKTAIRLTPTYDSYNGLGWSIYWKERGLHNNGNYGKAENVFKMAIQLKPDYGNSYDGLAWTYLYITYQKPWAENNYTRIINLFEKSIEFDKNRWESYYGLGHVYFFLLDFNKSLEYYDKAAELNPDHAAIYAGVGWVYYRLAHDHFYDVYDKAVENFEKAIELDKHHFESYLGLGWSLHEQGRDTEALEQFNNVLQFPNLASDSIADTYAGLTSTYKHLGDFDLAVVFGKKAIEINPNIQGYHARLGFLYRQMGVFEAGNKNFAKAKEYFELANPYFIKTVELHPKLFTGWLGLGWNSYSLGNYQEALSYLTKTLERNSRDAPAYEGLGRVYYNLRQYDKAIEMFNKAIEINPEEGSDYNVYSTYDSMGWAYLRKNEYTKALEYFNKALQGHTPFKTTYLGLAFAHYKRNNLKDSDAMISRTLSTENFKPKSHTDPYLSQSFVECMREKEYTPKIVADCIETTI